MVNGHCADALVCISNCDKIIPGMHDIDDIVDVQRDSAQRFRLGVGGVVHLVGMVSCGRGVAFVGPARLTRTPGGMSRAPLK
jgi:Dehydratase family